MTLCLRAKENVMSSTQVAALLLALAAGVFTGCRETPLVPDANQTPIADAQVIGTDGQPHDQQKAALKGGNPMLLVFPYAGTPLHIMLDGSASKDDGKIVRYQWFSANKNPDAGGRSGPNPDDVKNPTVTLGAGSWSFALWVTDDKGVVSDPDVVSFTIGMAAADDPAVLACIDNTSDGVADKCKQCICGKSAECRTAVVKTACPDDCCALINCIATKCPDFAAMAMAMPPDYSCYINNCASFGMQAGAMAAGACAVMCPDDCRGDPSMMPPAATDAGMMPAAMTDSGMMMTMPVPMTDSGM